LALGLWRWDWCDAVRARPGDGGAGAEEGETEVTNKILLLIAHILLCGFYALTHSGSSDPEGKLMARLLELENDADA
jgi:hypothetical protein